MRGAHCTQKMVRSVRFCGSCDQDSYVQYVTSISTYLRSHEWRITTCVKKQPQDFFKFIIWGLKIWNWNSMQQTIRSKNSCRCTIPEIRKQFRKEIRGVVLGHAKTKDAFCSEITLLFLTGAWRHALLLLSLLLMCLSLPLLATFSTWKDCALNKLLYGNITAQD